jgi:TonB family protein
MSVWSNVLGQKWPLERQMAQMTNRAVFNKSLLLERRLPWKFLGAGLGLQLIVLAVLVILPMLMPEKIDAVRRHWITLVEAPPIAAWEPQPAQSVRPMLAKREIVKEEIPQPAEIIPPRPRVYNPVISAPIAKPATARKNAPAPDMTEVAKALPDQLPPISMGSSAIPTLKKPREAVQTGGFGDPDGVVDNGNRNRAPNIAQLGSYDLPQGPGYGNGTGGSKGWRGVVASPGFGNGLAVTSTGGRASHGTVKQGVFADESANVAAPVVKQASIVMNAIPVVILFKPHPAYTDEARAKKIEGEVLLQVVFSASGEVRVQRVLQGLGYGLDDSAQAAARQIRFRPAEQSGQSIDSTAIVHIKFQLAY